MRAKVLRSFVSNQPRVRASAGDIIELPEDVDWELAGLVVVIEDDPRPEINLEDLKVPGLDKKYHNRIKKLVEDASLVTPEKAVTRSKGSQPKPEPKASTNLTVKKPVTKSSQTKAGKK